MEQKKVLQWMMLYGIIVLVLVLFLFIDENNKGGVDASIIPLIRKNPSVPTRHFIPRSTLSHLLNKFSKGEEEEVDLKKDGSLTIPVKGNVWPVGGYYTKIYVGTPWYERSLFCYF